MMNTEYEHENMDISVPAHTERHEASSHSHAEEEHSISSYKLLSLILGALFGLTLLTVKVAQTDLGEWHDLHIWLAIMIASIKSFLIMWFFMHIRHEKGFIRWSFLTTLGFLVIMISFIFLDIAFR